MLPIGLRTNPYLISSPYITSTVAAVPLVPTAMPAAVPSTVILPSETTLPPVPFAYYGYDLQRVIKYENYKTVEDIIDSKIKERVNSQIEQYEKDRKDFREKYESCCEIECPRRRRSICWCENDIDETKTNNEINRELTLEEKIELIRRELNLPRPAEERNTLDKRTQINLDYEWDHRHRVTEDKPKVMFPSSDLNGRSRSATRISSALPSRSRSPSLGPKPIWRPTGANDYSWTNSTRASILNGEYQSSSVTSAPKEPEKKFTTKANVSTTEIKEIPVIVTKSEKPKFVKFTDYSFEPSYTVYEAKKTTLYGEVPRETTMIKVKETVYPQIVKPKTKIENATSTLGSGYVKYAPMTINIKDSKAPNTFNFVGPL